MTRLEGEDFHGMVEIIVAGYPCRAPAYDDSICGQCLAGRPTHFCCQLPHKQDGTLRLRDRDLDSIAWRQADHAAGSGTPARLPRRLDEHPVAWSSRSRSSPVQGAGQCHVRQRHALAWRAHGGSRWAAIHGESVMRPQQRKSHPHRILPPALHRQQLRVVLRRGLEAEARAVREYMRECETEQRKTKYLVLAFWTVYCLLFLSIPLILS